MENQFIDIKNQKPEIGQKVIALAKDGREIDVIFRFDETFGSCDFYFSNLFGNVSYFTHWKPN